MTEPAMFAIPAGPAVQLDVEPRLASWNRAGDPDQMKLEAFLAATEQVLRPRYEQLTGPLALRLDIGLPPATPLLDQRDLDNYLFPLAARMSKTTGTRLVSVWGTKQHSAASFARIEPAAPIQAPAPGGPRYIVRTDRSSQITAFKQQIHDQLTGAATLPDGSVRMQLSFTVGPDGTGSTCGSQPSTRSARSSAAPARADRGIHRTAASSYWACTARWTMRLATRS